MMAQDLFILEPAEKFDLTKLARLEAARRLKPSAKRHEVGRQHGFQNRELCNQHAHDLSAAAKQARGLVHLVTPLP